MVDLPHGTVTFLFTDIEGSTRLLKQLGDRYGVVLDGLRLADARADRVLGLERRLSGGSDFLNVLFGRSSLEPASKINNNNPSEFADPAIDRQIDRALAETADPVTSQAAWARVDRLITDQAPVVALFNPKTIDAVSKRVGNHQYSGSGLGVLIDQLWVR